MKIFAGICIFLFYAVSLFANGPYRLGEDGNTAIAVKNNDISLVREEIRIDMKSWSISTYQFSYDCTYCFENKSDTVRKVLIGSPQRFSIFEDGQGNRIKTEYISVMGFRYLIDNIDTEFGIFKAGNDPSADGIDAYDAVCIADVVFGPGEKKTIRNTYSVEKHIDCILTPGSRPGDKRKISAVIECNLQAGKLWNGPVGHFEALISFNMPGGFFDLNIKPEGYTLKNQPYRIQYAFDNYTPAGDLTINFGLKKNGIDELRKQADGYFRNNDFTGAFLLLHAWDVLTVSDEKDNAIRDYVRSIAFRTAEAMKNADYYSAKQLYIIALHHARSHTAGDYLLLEFPGGNAGLVPRLSEWVHEDAGNTPCYQIVYNLAALCSRSADLRSAALWLGTAFAMKPDLREYAETDPDMAATLKFMKIIW
ncbi:MAG: hypothetical protein JW874_11105 [Spirochaetales bacterium]|nr:hypothetical protein [Spirochaetales bacterium]